MLALDTTALLARMTCPSFRSTPTARPPSIRMRSTCDFMRTLPPFFFTPLHPMNRHDGNVLLGLVVTPPHKLARCSSAAKQSQRVQANLFTSQISIQMLGSLT